MLSSMGHLRFVGVVLKVAAAYVQSEEAVCECFQHIWLSKDMIQQEERDARGEERRNIREKWDVLPTPGSMAAPAIRVPRTTPTDRFRHAAPRPSSLARTFYWLELSLPHLNKCLTSLFLFRTCGKRLKCDTSYPSADRRMCVLGAEMSVWLCYSSTKAKHSLGFLRNSVHRPYRVRKLSGSASSYLADD